MEISLTTNDRELNHCAELMYNSEPWITLKFNLEKCRNSFNGEYKEIYVVKMNDEVVGFAVLLLYGVLRGYIQTICIAPEFRNKGIGTALLKMSEARILKMSPNVFICVSSFNAEAQKLYERFGFEKIGELKNHIAQGYDEYILRKSFGTTSEFVPSEK